MVYCERAYAKVNLHLEVLNKRPNGYHNIFSVMSSVGIFDLLKLYECELVSGDPKGLTVNIIDEGGTYPSIIKSVPPEKNLIYKAIQRYAEANMLTGTVSVGVEKNIPAGGGLGGGSTDAAAILRFLNGRYSLLSNEEMVECASKIGADVPFCLEGGTAFCEGIGDRIIKIKALSGFYVLIANDGTHVDTSEAYKRIDFDRSSQDIIKNQSFIDKEVLQYVIQTHDFKKLMHTATNDFEKTVFAFFPSVLQIKKAMIENGASFSIMTGSGSTVIGIFEGFEIAHATLKRLEHKNIGVFLSEFVNPVNH
jgi:4-diphosphocytidyl-2-C-methyl-D-erythritol kinase